MKKSIVLLFCLVTLTACAFIFLDINSDISLCDRHFHRSPNSLKSLHLKKIPRKRYARVPSTNKHCISNAVAVFLGG